MNRKQRRAAGSQNDHPAHSLPADSANAFAQAITLHQTGRLNEAEILYKKLLDVHPANVEALNLLGALQIQKGNMQEAVGLLTQVISITPSHAEAHSRMGLALFNLKRYDEALSSYGRAITGNPDNAEARNNRGFTLYTLERYPEAVADYDRVIAIHPRHAEAYVSRGQALYKLKKYQEALADYDKAIALNPQYAEAHNNRGNILKELGRHEEALACLKLAITLRPDYAEAINNRGLVFHALKQYQEALADYDRAITLNPHYADAYINRGASLHSLKRYDDALRDYDRALTIQPGNVEALNNRATTLNVLNRHEEALECLNRAIAIKPNFANSYNSRGSVFAAIKQYQEALADYDRAIALDPDCADAYWDKSLLKILLGEYEEGWALYEWRWKGKNPNEKPRTFVKPCWLGKEPLAGKTLFIHTEQGLGDSIQFCRYVPALEAAGAKVILEVPPALMGVMATLSATVSLAAKGTPSPEFDMYCPVMSLPLAMKTNVDTIPAKVPYLFTDKDNHTMWKERLGNRTRPRIGLVCSGNAQHSNDYNRSIPLGMLAPILEQDFECHLIHKEIRAQDAGFLAKSTIITHEKELNDFMDSASLVSEMDVIISVDTAIAHLAGALGKPVWILLPFAPDYRWMAEREDSPWYPTARLFRQQKAGDWTEVVERMKGELALFKASKAVSL